ncbi:acylphosphatase [Xanthobacter sp. DSM 24535]|uniref:acylphosphatase n=1 Tax=Roseixanthobacter psychrophilus TaxID=3119917 RepID=UPI0037273898
MTSDTAETPVKVVHLIVEGRVQGVGYRAWCAEGAQGRGLSGWVRNRASGSVEAVLAGPAEAVDEMAAASRTGPAGARVDTLRLYDAADTALAASGGWGRFVVLPTL